VADDAAVLEIPRGEPDAAARLGETSSDAFGVVAAVGVIECLPAAEVVDLLRHAVRVMRPDGVVLIESANPTVLGTFTSGLYADPAVRRPYHPSLVRFLLAEAGCTSVEFEWFDPAGDALGETTADAQQLSELLFGPTRYLAVGRR
jgi:SAM-dependent methyltransferase